MKKEIESLTQEEVSKICSYYYDDNKGCIYCPLCNHELNFINDCKNFESDMKKHKAALKKKIKIDF